MPAGRAITANMSGICDLFIFLRGHEHQNLVRIWFRNKLRERLPVEKVDSLFPVYKHQCYFFSSFFSRKIDEICCLQMIIWYDWYITSVSSRSLEEGWWYKVGSVAWKQAPGATLILKVWVRIPVCSVGTKLGHPQLGILAEEWSSPWTLCMLERHSLWCSSLNFVLQTGVSH